MAPYVGEIRMFGGNFAPAGWAFCAGQLLPIEQNEVLFQLIGTTYGGDGESTFALPDLRGRLPLHQGSGFVLGQAAGVEQVTISTAQTPTHSHPPGATTTLGNTASPQNALWAASGTTNVYTVGAPGVNMAANMLSPAGGSQPHENMPPFLCVNFIISLFGVFPSPT